MNRFHQQNLPTDDRLVLTWNQQVGAAGWQLYRSIDGGPETRLPTLSASKNEYLDGRVKPGQKATYRLRLIRQDGRRSPFSQPFEIRTTVFGYDWYNITKNIIMLM